MGWLALAEIDERPDEQNQEPETTGDQNQQQVDRPRNGSHFISPPLLISDDSAVCIDADELNPVRVNGFGVVLGAVFLDEDLSNRPTNTAQQYYDDCRNKYS